MQNLGKLSGGNLFFSFQYFNVATGETALFTTTSAGINNVISRVTGGYASTIDGTIELQAAAGAPNFFLINPSGITFTSNAVVDVPAAFYVSTANYLKFPDGNFYVDPSRMSTLSSAAPEAFGFLGHSRSPVDIQGTTLSAGSSGNGEFEIAAGDVTIDGEGAQGGIVSTTGGVRVTAVGAQAAEVSLTAPFDATDGLVMIRNGGVILSLANGNIAGGAIYVNAGSLLIDGTGEVFDTAIASVSQSAGAAGPIYVAVGANASIVDGGAILSQTYSSGNAGDLSLTSKSLTITGQGLQGLQGLNPNSSVMGIVSDTFGSGDAANIHIETGSLTQNGGNAAGEVSIASYADPGSSGNAGQILLNVSGSAAIVNGATIVSGANSSGNAGDVALTVGSLSIDAQGNSTVGTGITANTSNTGNGGNIHVTAGSLMINGVPSDQVFVGISSDVVSERSSTASVTGAGGAVDVDVKGNVSLTNNGEISSSSFYSTGHAGNINVQAGGMVSLQGGGVVTSSSTFGPGTAGDINFTAAGLSIQGQNVIYPTGVFALSADGGNAGNIYVTVGSLFIDGGGSELAGGLGSEAIGVPGTSADTSASAGRIVVNVQGSATVEDGGAITTSSETLGPAGSITVRAGSLTVGGVGLAASIASVAVTGSAGQPGTVSIAAGKLAVLDNGFISIENDATLPEPTIVSPTNITIHANNVVLDGGVISAGSTGNIDASAIDLQYTHSLRASGSSILTSANEGNGGTIAVSGSGVLWLDQSNLTTSVAGKSGNGGDITINVPYIVMNTGAIQANTAALRASGGNVTIDAQALIPSFQSFVLGGIRWPSIRASRV
jgi:filamentous hemagglutinin family protein